MPRIHEAVARLPDDLRAVFDLLWYQEMSQAERRQAALRVGGHAGGKEEPPDPGDDVAAAGEDREGPDPADNSTALAVAPWKALQQDLRPAVDKPKTSVSPEENDGIAEKTGALARCWFHLKWIVRLKPSARNDGAALLDTLVLGLDCIRASSLRRNHEPDHRSDPSDRGPLARPGTS